LKKKYPPYLPATRLKRTKHTYISGTPREEMVLGRQGLKLEVWKFGVYIIAPIGASLTFNDPRVQSYCADYFQFLKYPANPNTNLKEEFEELQKKREVEKEQRMEYAKQVRKLQESAQRRRLEEATRNTERKGWFSWMRFRRKRDEHES
jgi:hypothetical protein